MQRFLESQVLLGHEVQAQKMGTAKLRQQREGTGVGSILVLCKVLGSPWCPSAERGRQGGPGVGIKGLRMQGRGSGAGSWRGFPAGVLGSAALAAISWCPSVLSPPGSGTRQLRCSPFTAVCIRPAHHCALLSLPLPLQNSSLGGDVCPSPQLRGFAQSCQCFLGKKNCSEEAWLCCQCLAVAADNARWGLVTARCKAESANPAVSSQCKVVVCRDLVQDRACCKDL